MTTKKHYYKNKGGKLLARSSFIILTALVLMSSVLAASVFASSQGNAATDPSAEPAFAYGDWYQDYSTYNLNKLKRTKIPREARALFSTGVTAETEKYHELIDFIGRTELNAIVIDIKEGGYVTYKTDNKYVREVNSDAANFIKDLDKLIYEAKEKNIYLIARIVAFNDTLYARAKPEVAFQLKTGGVWRDYNGIPWVDPYHREAWEYNVSIAQEVAAKGFDEIQYDYVRFPYKGKEMDKVVAYAKPEDMSKAEVIANFLAYAREELEPYNVYLSADVFGWSTTALNDLGIGQQWELISPNVDYISPMLYPSHYDLGLYGIDYPDAYPYKVIKTAITDALERDQMIRDNGQTPAIIRPWYQDFTADWVKGYIVYGAHEVREQIRAGVELGVGSYMMWNQRNNFNLGAWE